jgi:aminoglycoside phosphotransferase (APT) family kinase protein
MNNMLVDPESNKITALLDFDFASVLHPSHEFFMSLWDVGGNPAGGHGQDLTGGRLAKAILKGSFDMDDDVPEEAAELWSTARVWDAALAARGAMRPSDISGMAGLDQLRRLETALCPFQLVHPMILKQMTAEQVQEQRAAAEKTLVACLDALGF